MTTTTSAFPLAAEGQFTLSSLLLPTLALLFLLFIVLRGRAAQRRALEQRASIQAGARVMSASGLFGTVVERDDDAGTVRMEIAPGVVVTQHVGTLSVLTTQEPAADLPVVDREVEPTTASAETDEPTGGHTR